MANENVIELKHISKSFPGIKANDDISLDLRKGEIHALLGENGAGKSTLMSILFGLYEPDEGEIYVKGEKTLIKNPNDATRLGIGMVHQHFKLVECYTALQNIILGYEPVDKLGFLRPKRVKASIDELCKKYDFKIDLNEKIDDMSVGDQQKVEILKMLYRNNDILIFDEPTAVLTPQEIEELMHSMKNLVKEGKSILFISHKLNEIMEVADRVTILSKGRCLGTLNVKDTNPKELSRLMVGRDVELVTQKDDPKIGEDVLTVSNLCVYNAEKKKETVHNVSFKVRKGEIVCIAGIEGNGQTDLIYAITGLEKVSKGEIILHNVDRLHYTQLEEDFYTSIDTNHKTYKEELKKLKAEKSISSIKYGFKVCGCNIKYGIDKSLVAIQKFNRNYIEVGFNYVKYGCNKAWFATKNFFVHTLFKKDEIKFVDFSPKEFKNLPRYCDVHLEYLTIRQRNMCGVSHVPEDRHKYGLALDFSLTDNIVLQRYFEPTFQKFGFINKKAKEEYAKKLIAQYDVRSSQGAPTIVRSMSGGNQQKAILARELDRKTPLLITVQPTRGLDVGAIESIHKNIIKQRDSGNGVLLVSLELEEVLNLSDRILVMFNGEIVAELDSKKTNANEIGLYMSGAKRMFDSTLVKEEK